MSVITTFVNYLKIKNSFLYPNVILHQYTKMRKWLLSFVFNGQLKKLRKVFYFRTLQYNYICTIHKLSIIHSMHSLTKFSILLFFSRIKKIINWNWNLFTFKNIATLCFVSNVVTSAFNSVPWSLAVPSITTASIC